MLKIKYNNREDFIEIEGYMCSDNLASISGKNIEENTSGYIIYNEQDEVVTDCSEYKYRWDVLENDPDRIFYTNIEGYVQTEPLPKDDSVIAESLNNEALTECVADLMYEVSLMQLGMEVSKDGI